MDNQHSTTSAFAGDSTLAPVDPDLAPPIRMIDPRVPVWRRVETLDDVQAEAGDLANLLDATMGILKEMDYSAQGGGRNKDLDKVDALVRHAQGVAEYLTCSISHVYSRYKEITVTADYLREKAAKEAAEKAAVAPNAFFVDAAEDKLIRDLHRLNAAGLRKFASLLEESDREGFASIVVILRRMADTRDAGHA